MQHLHYKAEYQACWFGRTGQALEPEVYPRPDGSVYICGSPEHIALPNDPKTIQVDPKSVEDLKEVARSVSSKLSEAPLEVGQSCFLPISPDGLPVMGQVPGVQGAYIASGKPNTPPPLFPPFTPINMQVHIPVWLYVRSMNTLALVALIHVTRPHTTVLIFDWMCCLRSKTFFCLTAVQGIVVSVLTGHNVTGHSCWGILNGPATGLVMAELIAEGKASSVDIRKLDPQRLA